MASKVIVFIGSLRKESFNRKIFESYKKLSSLQFEEADYSDFPLFNEDIEKQDVPESVQKVKKLIKDADALIFFSPEYNASIPGPLKNAIDWLSRGKDQPFDKKPTAIIGATLGRLGTSRMQYDLRKVAGVLGMNVLARPEVMIADVHSLMDDSGKLADEKTKEILKKHVDIFEKFVAHNS